tara:strand:+ start:1037 stop:1291 length:255 start_codon:yes stop_codon:yes gene_type:complete
MKLFAAFMLMGLSATPALAHSNNNHHHHNGSGKHNHCHLHQYDHIFHCHKHGKNSNHHGDLHHTRSRRRYRSSYLVPFFHIEIN